MRKGKRKGSSHSTRPISSEVASICNLTEEQVEGLIVELAKRGYTPSMIGMILRDQYGVPLTKLVIDKKITQVLKERGLAPKIPEDLANLIRRATTIRRHLEEHPKDMFSRRGLQLVESKIHRLVKYYKREGVLPPDFQYKPEKIIIIP
ncbi:MAG: 30S ribosomal protein S15 [Thermoprotei archaeon]|nr:MAG: 30S ribosomal protein S15 [Thermoprotei archaeon]RLF18115.1 MAG: 30S ribosomal protein S15 [Thermoprotei archaeon]